jgi:hypothetical protein
MSSREQRCLPVTPSRVSPSPMMPQATSAPVIGPVCRLDDIFEPTLGEVIQAAGSEVLQFAPDEPSSLVSAPILFVQDQRHLIGN